MLKRERQAYILHQVNLHNKVLSAQLCQEINVSEDTIRRDLQELADQNKLIKVHGGALSHSFSQVNFTPVEIYSQANKQEIARKAAALIEDGMFILTTGGTTILEMARALPPGLKATFISGSIPVIMEYSNHPNIDVIFTGDRISKSSKIAIGAETVEKIKDIRADICFLGINAIDTETGITDNDWEVVQVKKAMIASAQQVVALTISEKLNSSQKIKVCGLDKVNVLITELDPGDVRLTSYKKAGVTVL